MAMAIESDRDAPLQPVEFDRNNASPSIEYDREFASPASPLDGAESTASATAMLADADSAAQVIMDGMPLGAPQGEQLQAELRPSRTQISLARKHIHISICIAWP